MSKVTENGKIKNKVEPEKRCYICNYSMKSIQKGIRKMKDMEVFKCNGCGLETLENFDHITEDFYTDDGLSTDIVTDTMMFTDTERRYKRWGTFLEGKTWLDFGCEYGWLLKKVNKNNTSTSCYALEPNENCKDHLVDFINYKNINDIPIDSTFDVITLFHVLEHLKNPLAVLEDLYLSLEEEGKIIIEVPNSEDLMIKICPAYRNFIYAPWHLFMFNQDSLIKLISKTKFKVRHIQYIQRYPLSNHLHWLATGKPGGHEEWEHLTDINLDKEYERKLRELGQTDTVVFILQK